MKLRHLLLGTVAALGSVSAANAAMTTPHGWYLSLGAGVNWIEDGSITEFDPPGVFERAMQFSWDDGFIATGAVGYDFANHWRAEFEVAYRDNDADGFCTIGGCAVGSTDVWELSQMLNVLYDFDLGGNWSASAGAGVGGNLVVLRSSSFFDPSSVRVEDDDYVFAGQLILQVAYRLAERWQFYLDYHFMLMEDPEFTNPGDRLDVFEMEKTDHSVLIGVRFDLQRDSAPPPPMAPAPPPPPPMKAPRQFIVFFGFNRYNLTPEAARVVADAAAAAKEYGSATIIVVGHTDTVGSPKYNLRLSLRRSQSVKDGLVVQGVPAAAITTAGKGESELMVQTGDGVKDPQNRRATVDVQ